MTTRANGLIGRCLFLGQEEGRMSFDFVPIPYDYN